MTIDGLARVMCMSESAKGACGPHVSSRLTTVIELDPETNKHQRGQEPSSVGDSSTAGMGGGGSGKLSPLESDVREVRGLLESFASRQSDGDVHARATKQWRLVARVLDRLFFFLYCATVMISLAAIFL